MTDLRALDDLAREVESVPRLAPDTLKSILRRCYEIGKTPIDDDARAALLRKIGSVRGAEGAGRVFTLKSRETPYTLLVRYVFSSSKERSNASRYATVLNWMHQRQVAAADFAATMAEHGGMSNIYWLARGRDGKTLTRNKLTLSTNITVNAGEPFTLRLKAGANGIFEVLDMKKDGTL